MIGATGWRKALIVLAFLGPSLVTLLAFSLGPMVGTAWVSLQEWNLIRDAEFIGIDNYRELWGDEDFRRALRNTLYYLVGYLPLVMAGGLGLAVLVNRRLRGVAIFRAMYFLPVVTSWVVVALLWRWLLNPSDGIVNWLLGRVGIDGPGWWTDRTWAMPSVILASAWKDLGFVMVILLAGLQAIDPTLYEAARIDGAGAWRQLRSVTHPAAHPVAVLRARDQPHQRLPGLRPGVGDDRRRPGRSVHGRRRADRQEHVRVRPGRLRRGAERRAVRDHPRRHRRPAARSRSGGCSMAELRGSAAAAGSDATSCSCSARWPSSGRSCGWCWHH